MRRIADVLSKAECQPAVSVSSQTAWLEKAKVFSFGIEAVLFHLFE
jgi:hypothetical protein